MILAVMYTLHLSFFPSSYFLKICWGRITLLHISGQIIYNYRIENDRGVEMEEMVLMYASKYYILEMYMNFS